MKFGFFRILGLAYLIIGIIFVFINSPSFTGFSILSDIEDIPISFIGIAFLIIGVLFLTEGERQRRNTLGEIIKNYESGIINPVQAASQVNDNLYLVEGVRYKEGLSLTVLGNDGSEHSIGLRGDKARDLALAFYEAAIINNPENSKYCELHMGKGASTKHHLAGFRQQVRSFESRYHADLEKLARAA